MVGYLQIADAEYLFKDSQLNLMIERISYVSAFSLTDAWDVALPLKRSEHAKRQASSLRRVEQPAGDNYLATRLTRVNRALCCFASEGTGGCSACSSTGSL